MPRFSFAFTLPASTLLTLTCAQAPTETNGLSLEAAVSRSVIPVGQTDTLTFRLRNLTARTVSLTFGSSCQVLPYIEDVNDGVVYPHGGYVCLTVITTLTLPAFGEKTMIQEVHGDTIGTPGSGPTLAPGSYRAYAVLDRNSEQAELRSEAVAFTIQ